MKFRMLALLVAAGALALPFASYAQSDTTRKDSSVTKDRPAATKEKSATSPETDTTKPKKERSASRDKDKPSDAGITTRIKTAYVKDKLVRARNIKVETEQGVVHLTGTARSQAEADKAESIAKSTKGVTSVKNDIQVQAPKSKSSSTSDTPKKSSSKDKSSSDMPKSDTSSTKEKK